MAQREGASSGYPEGEPVGEQRTPGFHPDMELMERWMVLDDWGAPVLPEEHELLGALQPDSTPTLALETLSAFLHSCGQLDGDAGKGVDASGIGPLGDAAEKRGTGASASSKSASSTESGSPSKLLDEFLKLKLADRRRRNRESSARCYYRRKRRAAAVKEELEETKRRVRVLSSRQQTLMKENSSLRKRLTLRNKGAEHAGLPGEANDSCAQHGAAV